MSESESGKAQEEPRAPKPSPGKEDKKAALKRAQLLLWGVAIATLLLTIYGFSRAFTNENRVHLKLAALSAEKTELPPALADRGIPLEKLHDLIEGANLDKPRAHIALFQNGRQKGEAWGSGAGLKGAIASAFEKATQAHPGSAPTDAVLVIPTDRRLVHGNATKRHFSNVHRGVRGVFIEGPNDEYRLSPTMTVATNRAITDQLKIEAKKRDLELSEWLEKSVAHSFSAKQFYIPLGTDKKAQEMVRGNRTIPVEEVTKESVAKFEQLLTDWMLQNLNSDGRLTYIYYPSAGREATSNNMIRQWMGTVAIGRAAKIHPERHAAKLSEANIRYNLSKFYKNEGEVGLIEYRQQSKLGAAALAMISLIESPERASFQTEETALMNLTRKLWQDNGRFKTFYRPESRNDDNHNFYPGETLLAWSFLYNESKEASILDMSMKSMRHYKDWHLKNRNPAFIPWHTQAYYNLWRHTKSDELRDWVFQMNDWLVDAMQTHSRVAYDDTIGRFYNPKKRYGVPHASSTGVYLEGLIDAFALAREIGDKKHEEKYRKAIVLGLRSSMQLQFQDDVDMFYAGNKRRLRGGMRTAVYDNVIRVDNVQHVLMGVQKIIREFKDDDYQFAD